MSFVRPEARAALRRYREVIVGVVIAVLALWWLSQAVGIMRFLAPAILVAAGALIMVGLQRARFRGATDGVGAVQVVEGRIAYFGPLTGGSVALSEISHLVLDGRPHPPHWVLEQPGRPPLHIPVDAAGAEALFDVFASLPGLSTRVMLMQLDAEPAQAVTIWRRGQVDLASLPPQGRA